MSSYPPYYAYPSAPPVVRAVPDPPRLHWGWVLVLSYATLGVFGQIWMIVQCAWVRKVYGKSKTLPWAIANACVLPLFFLGALGLGFFGTLMHVQNVMGILSVATTLVRILLLVLWIVTIFSLRGELSAYPLDIPLGGGMTFFFGPIYFQYHLFDYQVSDAVHLFRGPLRPELPPPPPREL